MIEDWDDFCSLAPRRFFANISIISTYLEPPKDCILTDMSKEIWDMFEANKITRNELINRIYMWVHLKKFLKKYFPHHGLLLTGSALSGFALKRSDVDFCFIPKGFTKSLEPDQKLFYSSPKCLFKAFRLKYDITNKMELINKGIPIFKLNEGQYNLCVHMSCCIVSSLRNTYLFYYYGQVDWRVKPLVIFIKVWAKYYKITDSKNPTLSSFSLMLMVINFLQTGVSPPVLPNLQKILEENFKDDVDIRLFDFFKKVDVPFHSKNCQTLKELLCEFFLYYSSFNFRENVISVREGQVIPLSEYISKNVKSKIINSYAKGYIFTEDPFTMRNISKKCPSFNNFNKIQHVFYFFYLQLQSCKSIKSIFNEKIKNINS